MRKLNNEPADIKYVALGPRQTYFIMEQYYHGVFDTMKYPLSIFYICICFSSLRQRFIFCIALSFA